MALTDRAVAKLIVDVHGHLPETPAELDAVVQVVREEIETANRRLAARHPGYRLALTETYRGR